MPHSCTNGLLFKALSYILSHLSLTADLRDKRNRSNSTHVDSYRNMEPGRLNKLSKVTYLRSETSSWDIAHQSL